MKTVGDFRKKDWVAVVGDVIESGNPDSEHALTERDVNNINIGGHIKERALVSFAWRTNTGVKPGFSGDIDAELTNGEIRTMTMEVAAYGGNLSREETEDNYGIIKWRPHLPKVEDKPKSPYDVDAHVSGAKPVFIQLNSEPSSIKPVGDWFSVGYKAAEEEAVPIFTQAMSDAGELVKAGMMFRTEAGEYEALLVNDKSVCFFDEDDFYVGIPIGTAKPIQTEREIAIEEIAKVLSDDYCDVVELVKPLDCFMSQSIRLYDAGYRLQTPKNNVT